MIACIAVCEPFAADVTGVVFQKVSTLADCADRGITCRTIEVFTAANGARSIAYKVPSLTWNACDCGTCSAVRVTGVWRVACAVLHKKSNLSCKTGLRRAGLTIWILQITLFRTSVVDKEPYWTGQAVDCITSQAICEPCWAIEAGWVFKEVPSSTTKTFDRIAQNAAFKSRLPTKVASVVLKEVTRLTNWTICWIATWTKWILLVAFFAYTIVYKVTHWAAYAIYWIACETICESCVANVACIVLQKIPAWACCTYRWVACRTVRVFCVACRAKAIAYKVTSLTWKAGCSSARCAVSKAWVRRMACTIFHEVPNVCRQTAFRSACLAIWIL